MSKKTNSEKGAFFGRFFKGIVAFFVGIFILFKFGLKIIRAVMGVVKKVKG